MLNFFNSVLYETIITENESEKQVLTIVRLQTKSGIVRYEFVSSPVGFMTNPTGGLTDNAAVKIPVQLQDVAVWFIFIRKRISVLIPEQSMTPNNGMIHTKSGSSLSEKFITSKSISVSPDVEPKMRKHSMQISSLPESPNLLRLFLLIKSTITNTFEA